MKKADASKRAKLIADNGLSGMFESDGSLRMEYANALAGKSGYSRNSYSENLRGEESVIAEDLAKVNAEMGLEGDEAITVHNGEFTAEERAKYSKVQKVVDTFAKKSGRKVGLVILSPNAHVNGNITPDSGRVYISADNLTNGNWADTVVHEFTHFAEGTAEYNNLIKMLSSDATITERAIDAVMKKGYGFDAERMRIVGEKIARGELDFSELGLDSEWAEGYTKYARKKGEYRGGTIVKRGNAVSNGKYKRGDPLIDSVFPPYDPYTRHGSEANRLAIDWAFKESTKAGDQALIAYHDRWYLVEKFDDMEFKYQIVRRVLKAEFEEISKEIEERGKSGKIKSIQRSNDRYDSLNKSSYSLKERGSSTNSNDAGYGREDTRVVRVAQAENQGGERSGRDGGGDRESGGLDRQGEGSEWNLTEEDLEMYAEFSSELGAHMSAEMLGNEAFIDRIIRSDASLAEKIIGKIVDAKEALARIGDPEAKAQHKRLAEAEKLYLKAIEAAGYQYVKGKIVVPEDEETHPSNLKHFSRKITPITEADLQDYLRAGGRQNKSKKEALSQGKKIILTTNEEIVSFINQSISDKKDLTTTAYGKVPEYLAKEVEQYSGGDIVIDGNYLEFVPDDIQHAYDEHLMAKEEGDINLSKEDFEKIPEYIETYDDLVYAIRYKSGFTKVCISKKTKEGRILLIQVVSKSRGSLNFKNMIGVSEQKYITEYQGNKKRNSSNTGGSESSNTSPHDDTASNNSVPQKTDLSTPKSKFSFKENDTKEQKPTTRAVEKAEERANKAEEKYQKERERRINSEEFGKIANRVIKLVNGIKDWKKGAFENAADAKNGTFKNIFGLLGNIASRGNISPITTRKAMAALHGGEKEN